MLNNKSKKIVVITLLIVMTFSAVVFAAGNIYDKKVTATIGRIKFNVDGKDVTQQIENKYNAPAFTVKEFGSRSYVPVRAIGELMGLDITYDDSTHTAIIKDPKADSYKKELEKKDKEILELKNEIEKMKKGVVDTSDLKSLEKKLNNNYGTYKDVDLKITLKESSSRIDVEITADLRDRRQQDSWNRMGHNMKKALVEDIVSDIEKEFPNVDIYGNVYDSYGRKNLITFDQKKNSRLNISYKDDRYKDDDRGRYGSLDSFVYDEFYELYIYGAETKNYKASGRSIRFDVTFRADSDNTFEWNRMSESSLKTTLDRIAEEAFYLENDGYYYDDYRDVSIDVIAGGQTVAKYTKSLNDSTGRISGFDKIK